MDEFKDIRVVAGNDLSLDIEHLDWWSLLGLAHQYGWRPPEGLDHYRKDPPDVIYGDVAATIADALRASVKDLSMKRAEPNMSSNPDEMNVVSPFTLEPDDYLPYFAGVRHGKMWMVGQFIGLCDAGDLEVIPLKP